MVTIQEPQQFTGIDQALNAGLELRAFTSGGGLRVVRIEVPHKERQGQLRGYGEHPHLMEALIFAATNYMAGGVDGQDGPEYLTGEQTAGDSLDDWLLGGHRVFAKKESGNVSVEARTYDYKKTIIAVETPTFRESYSGICKIIEPHHFDIANGFS
ncbi:MAG: hypothetical protein AABW71_03980 [Nanoarchaeota archaeon]